MSSYLGKLKKVPGLRYVLNMPGIKPIAKSAISLVLSYDTENKPDRKFLVKTIFPAIRDMQPRNLLFVGCQRYTAKYYKFFTEAGIECWTNDIDPTCARWGAGEKHIIGDFQGINHQCDIIFDVVIMNGVFGFGLNTADQIERSLALLWKIVRPGGFIVLGWNTDRIVDPGTLSAFGTYFKYRATPPLAGRHNFPSSTHIYDFLDSRILPLA